MKPPRLGTLQASALFARLTLLQLLRGRLVGVAALVAGLGLVMAALSAQGAVEQQSRIVADFCLAAAYVTGCAVAVAGVVVDAAQAAAARVDYPWLARPVARESLLLGRFFGLWALLGLFVLVLGGSGYVTVRLCAGEVPHGFVAATALSLLELGVLASTATLLTQLCAPPLAAAAAVVALMAGNFVPDLQALRVGADTAPAARVALQLLIAVLPDYARLSGRPYAAADVAPPWATVGWAVAYGLAYVTVCLALAALCARQRRSL